MTLSTLSIIEKILADDFRVEPARIHTDVTLSELGLDSLSLMEFVFAVEDSFRLRIPEDRLDPREAGMTLQRLCQVIDEITGRDAKAVAATT